MNPSVQPDTLRTVVGETVALTTLVAFTEHTIRSLAPVLILSAGMLTYSVVDETYDLLNGTNWLVYGVGLVAAGVFLTLNYTTRIGGVVVLAGLWFVLDGATTIRYGSARTPHEFVSGPESKAMLRMQIQHFVVAVLPAHARSPW